MSNFVMKTYADSYLFNNKVSKQDGENVAQKSMKALKDYIIKANRIDKNSNAFRGIIEEVKRQQRSSLYYTILMMSNVELCIGPFELPRAFKVCDMKDSKKNGAPTVFIDVTGMIEMTTNGYYICKKIDVLCAYLINAAVYMLYRYKPVKLMDNSNITITTAECYVSMFNYILDYLRIIGYSNNKNRISYYVAKFFLINMMGKDDDNYTNNIAMKIAGINAAEADAIRLFYVDGMYTNIYTFITSIAESFRLKGFSLEVFVQKWVYSFGTGTQYGTELFTSFANLLCNAYSAVYVLNQKQVEKCCGAGNLTRVFSEIEKIAVNSFDHRAFMGESAQDKYVARDEFSVELANRLVKEAKNINFSNSIEEILESANSIKDVYANSLLLSKRVYESESAGLHSLVEYAKSGNDKFIEGSLVKVAKVFKESMNDKDSYHMNTKIDSYIEDILEFASEDISKEDKQRVSRCVSELRECKKYL